MADAPSGTSFLKQKVGGIPVWAIVGAVGVGAAALIWYENSHKSSSSSSSTGTNAAGTAAGTATSAPPIYVSTPPSTASSGTSTTPASTTTPAATVTLGPAPGQANTGIWSTSVAGYPSADNSGQYSTVPFGQYPLAGQITNNMYPVSVNGQTLWVNGENVSNYSGGGGGMGGGWWKKAGMGGGGGPTPETPWERFTQKQHVPSYWASGMGGGSVQKLGKELGVPWQRIWSLNPQLHGRGGAHAPNEPVHVA